MSVQTEIDRIKSNIANAYTKAQEKGAQLPEEQNSDNLADTIDTILPETHSNLHTIDVDINSPYNDTIQSSMVGIVSGAGIASRGMNINVRAEPYSDSRDFGFEFVKWKENNTTQSTDSVYSFQVTKNTRLIAEFSKKNIVGVDWMLASPFLNRPFEYVAYGNNMFVALSGSGDVAYSTNGSSWTVIKNAIGSNIRDVTYGNDKFVAISVNGEVYYSLNGTSWIALVPIQLDTAKNDMLMAITYGGDRFVAISYCGNVYYSSDAISWTPILNALSTIIDHYWCDIAYGSNRFVAITTYPEYIAYSTNKGLNWSPSSISNSNNQSLNKITYVYNSFVITYYNASQLSIGSGSSWSTITNIGTGSGLLVKPYAIAYGNQKYVISDRYRLFYSTNISTTWKECFPPYFKKPYFWGDVIFGGNMFVAITCYTNDISTYPPGIAYSRTEALIP